MSEESITLKTFEKFICRFSDILEKRIMEQLSENIIVFSYISTAF